MKARGISRLNLGSLGSVRPRRRPPSDWIRPRSTIVVVGAARSGTSLLCSLMGATGQLGQPDEIFSPGSRKYPNPIGKDDMFHRATLARSRMSQNGICSFKLFSGQLKAAARQIRLWEFFPDPIFVRVFRDDLLGQAISLARARLTDKWSSRWAGSGEPAIYSAKAIDRALADIVDENGRWDRYFARNQVPSMKVRYEDIVCDHEPILRGIADQVGVTLASIPSIGAAGLKVQRDQMTEQWRRDFVSDAGALDRID
ncbi:Stf0 family sulfotransferase [Mesorhizobium sp.]|uniref:Stf0 family sulfotransferase n=1 Tax=Mesorhizobium sp. TaxID=1871066 RepID=UPI000FE622B4|nr:MAG: hypothetical protein EOQ47_12740 [Mesorhizobium sp.]